MTQVLFWNIENFGNEKFFSTTNKRKRGHGGLTQQQAATDRRALLSRVLLATQPDIIVVIEVGSGNNPNGDLATQTAGMTGLVAFQNALNNTAAINAGGWGLVPPLHVGVGGRAEAVGIFYRRQTGVGAGAVTRYFTGPNIWTGGYNGTSADPTAVGAPAAAAYPTPAPGSGNVDINAMVVPPGLGAVRLIPPGAQHNGIAAPNQRPENRVAARIDFPVNAGGAAGAPIDFGNLRQPVMATFTETVGGGVTRNLTLFAIHSPPQGVAATAYMATLATIWDIVRPLGANETRIIGGDFNLNLLAANGAPANPYAPLTAAPNNYQVLLNPTIGGAPPAGSLEQYKGYFSTHIRGERTTAVSRFLWSENGANQSFYPGYGYVGSNFAMAPFDSIDNLLVWPFQPAPHNYQTTVMNLVSGAPFGAVPAPIPGNPPVGTIGMNTAFNNPAPPAPPVWPPAPPAAAPNYQGIGNASFLTGWSNYGRIRNTSDHFAVFATV